MNDIKPPGPGHDYICLAGSDACLTLSPVTAIIIAIVVVAIVGVAIHVLSD